MSCIKKITRILEIPYVTCNSHKLNLEVKRTFAIDLVLADIIKNIANAMGNCNAKLRNWAMLGNIS